MKKLISMLLVCIFIFTNTFSCFANADVYTANEKLNHIIEEYSNAGFDVTLLDSNVNDRAYFMEIILDEETIVSNMVTEVLLNGDIKLTCTEAGKTDEILLKSNGEIYANNSKVIVKDDTQYFTLEDQEDSSISPRGQHYNTWVQNCPYGSASDYNKQVGSPIKKVLTLQQAIADFTVGGLCGIIIGLLFSSTILGSLVAAGVAATINYFRNNNAKARSMSCKRVEYVHGKKGEIIDGVHIRKNVITYYANKDYTTKVDTSVMYNKIKT